MSRIFCLPVERWQAEHTSAWITPLGAVLRVVKVLPQVQVTSVSTYAG